MVETTRQNSPGTTDFTTTLKGTYFKIDIKRWGKWIFISDYLSSFSHQVQSRNVVSQFTERLGFQDSGDTGTKLTATDKEVRNDPTVKTLRSPRFLDKSHLVVIDTNTREVVCDMYGTESVRYFL